ncbi:RICIN domain-containing protein [Streptomyces syringium]|uniref:RICIN domain-containing protein n=1 Tax=Streptomyces syringium TaxID=76729 RepID=UPI00367A3117
MRVPHPDHHEKIVGRLGAALGDERSADRRMRKVEAGRPRNHLTAVALNAFARLGAGKELTGFEAKLAEPFRKMGFTDAQLAEMGATHAAAGKTAREAVFPEAVSGLTTEQGYTEADFVRDLPKMAVDIFSMPNVRIIDSPAPAEQSLTAGPGGVGEEPEEFRRAVAESGWSLTLHAPPAVTAAPRQLKDTHTGLFGLRATKIYAGQESGDDHGTAEDEWYFGFVLTDHIRTNKYVSEVMEDINTGTGRDFGPNQLWYGPVGNGGLMCTVDCWEQDESANYEQYSGILNEFLQQWLEDIKDPTTWIQVVEDFLAEGFAGALVGILVDVVAHAIAIGIAAIIQACTAWMADDHVATTVLALTTGALQDVTSHEYCLYVDGRDHGEGMAYLFLQLDRINQPLRAVLNVNSGKALTAPYDGNRAERVYIQQDPFTLAENQWWLFQEVAANEYVVWNAGSMRVLELRGGWTDNGADIWQNEFNDNPARQVWQLDAYGDERVFKNQLSSKVIDISDESKEDGAKAHLWEWTGRPNQKWTITPPLS